MRGEPSRLIVVSASPIVDPDMPFRGLTAVEYEALVATGALDDVPVELLEGSLYDMAPQGPMHAGLTDALRRQLERGWALLGEERYLTRLHSPLPAGVRSVPEPDLFVYDADRFSLSSHPDFAHLVVEVADSSQGRDLVHKARIYASAGFPEYWVLDVPRHDVVVHRDPRGDTGYGLVQRLPFATELTALGVTLRISDLLDP
jgi:Uma2 family endonuclease